MAFITNNFPYISLALLLIVIILTTILVLLSLKIKGYFYSRKFRIKSAYEIDSTSKLDRFRVNVFNNNINDMRIMALGFIYKHQLIDYYQSYLLDKQLPSQAPIAISSRGYLDITIDQNKLYEIIKEANKGKYHMSRISFYVTDSLGYTTNCRATIIRIYFKRRIHQDKLVHDQEQRAIRQKARAELKAKRALQWQAKKASIKGQWTKFLSSFKKTKK